MTPPLRQLSDEGVAIWLDDMSRGRLVSGSLRTLVRDKHVVGVTTNPTIFHKAIAGSEVYAEQLHDLATLDTWTSGTTPRSRTACGCREPCHVMRPARTRARDRRVDPVAVVGVQHWTVGEWRLWAAADAASGAGDACCSARCTPAAPASGGVVR